MLTQKDNGGIIVMREAAEGKSKMLMLIARVNSNYDVKASYFAVRSDWAKHQNTISGGISGGLNMT